MSTSFKLPVVKIKGRGGKTIQQVKCTVVIRVGPGVDSILHALQTCYESHVTNIYVVDEVYTATGPIYAEENTAALLTALKDSRTQVRYNDTLIQDEIQTEIVTEMSGDCYMTTGAFKKKLAEVHQKYNKWDIFSTAPQTMLGFSIFNGLIFALFMFDWFRAAIHRFKLHQTTHVVFKVVNRKLGHPSLPDDTWFKSVARDSYSYGGAGTCLRPKKSGLNYFLYLCYSHAPMGLGSYTILLIVYCLFVGVPFYNWIPFVNHYIETQGMDEVFTNARLIMWITHSLLSAFLVNKYFVGVKGQALSHFHWLMALTIPLWLIPIFPIMLLYGAFAYKGYRAPPPPPSFTFPTFAKTEDAQKEENGSGDSDSE